MQKIEDGTAVYTKQDASKATHVGMITKQMGNIDWTQPAVSIERLIRGLDPWPGTYTRLNGKMLKIWRARAEEGESAQPAGTVAFVSKSACKVQTGFCPCCRCSWRAKSVWTSRRFYAALK